MSVAILIPVLDRPHRIAPLLANIAEATPEPHAVYFAASDQPTIDEIEAHDGKLLLRDEGDTWPRRINRLVDLTTEPYVFLGADDVRFHPEWLSILLRHVDGGIAVPADLHNPFGTLALVARSYTEAYGESILHPGYQHNYSDAECFDRARVRGKLFHCDDAVVEHLHHEAGKSPMDSTYEKGLRSFHEDRKLFESRRSEWA